jgi:hypothetical protein
LETVRRGDGANWIIFQRSTGVRNWSFLKIGRDSQKPLEHGYREGEIDLYQGDRIHAAIDALERGLAQECLEGDLRSIHAIAGQDDRVQGWIERSAHGW